MSVGHSTVITSTTEKEVIMKAITTALTAIAMVLVLGGCAPAVDTEPAPPDDVAAETTTALPSTTEEPPNSDGEDESAKDHDAGFEPSKSQRGNIVKKIGEEAGFRDSNGDDLLVFTVDAIDVDPTCSSGYPESPANGHYVAITITAESTPLLNAEYYFSFSEWSWQVYNTSGVRLNDPVGNAWSCMGEADLLPTEIGPAQKVHGLVVLDVADPHGIVVFAPDPTLSWEWSY